MKQICFLLFFLSLNFFQAYGQFILQVKSTSIHSCKNDSVEFIALVIDGTNIINDVTFKWSFGDGTDFETGLNLDTIKHVFKKGGGYIIRVDASKGVESDYVLYQYEIALTPNFSGTNSDIKDPICLGQEVLLTGKVADSTWKYKIPNVNKETKPIVIHDKKTFQSNFDYRVFNKTQFLTAPGDIDSVGVKLEHNNLNTLKIELICPSGKNIVLKEFGGANKFFGEPVIGGNPTIAGIGYNYYWTNSPTFGTMNSASPAGISLPAGNYAPEQAFNMLAGCPLNGEWKIKISDSQAPDSGFVFTTQLSFNKVLLPVSWEYKHAYSSPVWRGSGVSTTSSSGLATAIPDLYGNHKYTYTVTDNFACKQDTSVYNSVEPASLSALVGASTSTSDSLKGPFPLTIKFDNTTSWKAEYLWDFGDKTETSVGDQVEHIYIKDGIYKALLTATTDDGCKDTASVLITVTIPVSSFEDMPNAFTPNGDNKNDIYKISESSATGIETFNCWIYSRWGKKLAEWNTVEEAKAGWDGNFNGGQQATPGVYYYYLKAKGFDGREYEKKGSFQLFR